jgi:protein-L-isoaspartate(D-aspartate) O-methyltransferase
MPAPSPLPDENDRAFSAGELAVVRRAYARQMLAVLGVDNQPIEAAYAAVPREAFLGPPPWTVSSRYGAHRLAGADPVVLYQDLVIALDPARGVNNGSPSLHAKLLEALAPKPGEHIVHVGAGAGYYSAILAELVGPSGRVTAVEFDAALAERAKTLLSGRSNVRVVHGDGARWPETPVDGVYVNFAVSRPADRWIEGLAPGGRLVFPLGAPGPQRPNSGGRHSDRGAALRIERRGDAYAARAVSAAYFVCAEGEFEADPEELKRLRAAFDVGGLDTVRSLIWKRPALPDRCWFASKDWALSRDETP